jgi:hypothetical protein
MVNIDTILNLLCVGYPCIASYRAVKTRDAEGYKQWIVYWVIYTLIQIFEMLGDLILSWFPLYYEIKLAFMIWLTLPIFRGASTIYHNVLAPYLIRYESKIDEGLDGMWSQVEETAGVLKTDGVRLARSNSAAIFNRAQELVSQKMGGDSVSPRPTAPAVAEEAAAEADEDDGQDEDYVEQAPHAPHGAPESNGMRRRTRNSHK